MGVVVVVLEIQMGALTCKPDFDLHVGHDVGCPSLAAVRTHMSHQLPPSSTCLQVSRLMSSSFISSP
jgi:hypothetical protein